MKSESTMYTTAAIMPRPMRTKSATKSPGTKLGGSPRQGPETARKKTIQEIAFHAKKKIEREKMRTKGFARETLMRAIAAGSSKRVSGPRRARLRRSTSEFGRGVLMWSGWPLQRAAPCDQGEASSKSATINAVRPLARYLFLGFSFRSSSRPFCRRSSGLRSLMMFLAKSSRSGSVLVFP